MLNLLRPQNLQGLLCLKLIKRQLDLGKIRTCNYYTKRNLYDSANKRSLEARSKLIKKKNESLTCPETVPSKQDPNVCSSVPPVERVCTPTPSATCTPPKPNSCDNKPPPVCGPPQNPCDCDSSGGNNWIYALIAGGVIGLGTYYYFKSKKKDITIVPKNENVYLPKSKIPHSSKELPKHVPYLLIGGGTASFSAFRAIKSNDPKAKVLIISNEYEKPYMRPPLSKEIWYYTKPEEKDLTFRQWNGAARSLYYEPEEFYISPTELMDNENGGVAVAQGYTVKNIDVCNRKVILDDGGEIEYNECLIATGCSPKTLDVFESAPNTIKEKVSLFRTTDDFEYLKTLVDNKKSLAIVGSGFLGSELACSLAYYGKSKDLNIYQIYHESGNMPNVLPEYLSKWTTRKVTEQGVVVFPEVRIEEVSLHNNQLKLSLTNGQSVLADHVVVCIGSKPNTEIATSSGLELDEKLGGFVVNAELEARKHVFIAGDAACFFDPLLGRRRVEHHEHAVVTGRLAGENMVGSNKPFKHQSMFWSDLGPELGYEGVGLVDSSLETVGVFAVDDQNEIKEKPTNVSNCGEHIKDYNKGVIFYMKDDKIVGILLWNIFNRIETARRVINENKKFHDLNEVAKLFEIHS